MDERTSLGVNRLVLIRFRNHVEEDKSGLKMPLWWSGGWQSPAGLIKCLISREMSRVSVIASDYTVHIPPQADLGGFLHPVSRLVEVR